MNCYNDWYETAATMDDEYDTMKHIILPIITDILEEDISYIDVSNNMKHYCVDDHYNMVFKDFCKNCVFHEPQCICK
jgi:hypothetical protein